MPYTVKRNRGGEGGGVVNWVVCVGREERGGGGGVDKGFCGAKRGI